MKKTRKTLSVILSIIMIVSVIPVTASAATSGTCGDNLIWNYDASTYTLTISGEGDMYDYSSIGRKWYSSNHIVYVVINDGVTGIGNYAFDTCISLIDITIPDSVTSIGSGAFYGCESLSDITIPESVTSIGDSAFYGCTSLSDIILPDGVTYIGSHAFLMCKRLTNITIPNSVKKIGDFAFGDCTSLIDITIPDSTSIGVSAFYNTAYYNDESNWENGALYLSDHLVDVKNSISGSYVIKEGTITIASWAFYNCNKLTEVTIPASVKIIGKSAFYKCNMLKKIMVDSKSAHFSTDEQGVLFNKDKTVLVLCIPALKLESYTVPATVTKIADYAFYYCDSLTEVTIPAGVETIGDYAFYECTKLEDVFYSGSPETCKIKLNESNESLFEAIFHFITGEIGGLCGDNLVWSLDEATGTLTIYGEGEMLGVYLYPDSLNYKMPWKEYKLQIKKLNIKNGVTSICTSAFSGCKNLAEATIADTVKIIGISAFYKCESLTTIKIPDSVKTIPQSAFEGCTSLTDIIIPDSVISIDSYAFRDCTSLTDITIPDSVISISNNAFYDTAYYDDESNWENGVLYIGKHLYKAKSEISGSYVIKKGTISILESAFYNCGSLTNITIPDSVASIGEWAFYKCKKLSVVYYGGTQEQWKAVVKTSGNSYLLKADIHFNCLGPDVYGYETVVTPPTCTEQGYTTHTCECGKSYVDSYVDACHNYATPVYTAPPCVAKGYTIYECYCGATRIADYVDVTGHVDSDGDGACEQCNKTVGATSTSTSDTNTSGIFSIFNVILKLLQQLLNSLNILSV